MDDVDRFIKPFLEFMLHNFKGYSSSTSVLLSQARSPAQELKHTDFEVKEAKQLSLMNCFSVMIPLNLSATLLMQVDEVAKGHMMSVEVHPHQYLKFAGNVLHRGGENVHSHSQYRLHLLFSKRQEDMPGVDVLFPLIE